MDDKDIVALIDVWKLVESVRYSMVNLGRYEIEMGKERAEAELSKYMSPDIYQLFDDAQYTLTRIIIEANPKYRERLEELIEEDNDDQMYIWKCNESST